MHTHTYTHRHTETKAKHVSCCRSPDLHPSTQGAGPQRLGYETEGRREFQGEGMA